MIILKYAGTINSFGYLIYKKEEKKFNFKHKNRFKRVNEKFFSIHQQVN